MKTRQAAARQKRLEARALYLKKLAISKYAGHVIRDRTTLVRLLGAVGNPVKRREIFEMYRPYLKFKPTWEEIADEFGKPDGLVAMDEKRRRLEELNRARSQS